VDVKLLYVEWMDAWGCQPHWEDLEDAADHSTILIRSVGWVVREDVKSLTLTPNVSDAENCCGTQVIPKGCIKKRKVLKP